MNQLTKLANRRRPVPRKLADSRSRAIPILASRRNHEGGIARAIDARQSADQVEIETVPVVTWDASLPARLPHAAPEITGLTQADWQPLSTVVEHAAWIGSEAVVPRGLGIEASAPVERTGSKPAGRVMGSMSQYEQRLKLKSKRCKWTVARASKRVLPRFGLSTATAMSQVAPLAVTRSP